MLCMLCVLIFIVFMYYFTCISFAIRLSGRKSAIKLIDWCTLHHIICIRQQQLHLSRYLNSECVCRVYAIWDLSSVSLLLGLLLLLQLQMSWIRVLPSHSCGGTLQKSRSKAVAQLNACRRLLTIRVDGATSAVWLTKKVRLGPLPPECQKWGAGPSL